MTQEKDPLMALSELHRLCREVQREHKARMTPRGRKRKVPRGTWRRKR